MTRKLPGRTLIEHRPDGVFLLRLKDSGQCVGDTWHLSVEEAKEQAEIEFADHLSDWENIPLEVDDTVAFAVAKAPL
jgi:hypothetical protein